MLLVVGRVVAAEHRPLLQQDQLVRGQVVVVDAGRRDHARVPEPQPPGRELRVPRRRHVVQRLGELDLVRPRPRRRLGARPPVVLRDLVRQDAQPGETVAPEVDDRMPLERVDLQQPGVSSVRDQRGPRARGVDRGGGQLEVLGVLVVQDVEEVAGVLDAVLHTRDPGPDEHELAVRVGGVQQPHLAGDLAADAEDQVALAAGQPDAHPETLVGLLEDQHVLLGAEGVPVDLERPPRVVDPRVEERGPVGRPGAAVEDVGDLVRQDLAGLQVLEAQGEALVALEVGGVGQHPAVRGDGAGADGEEGTVAGQLVAVEQHLLMFEVLTGLDLRRCVAVCRDPAGDAVLLALLGAAEIPPRALTAGHGQVGFLGAPLDLLEDLLLDLGKVSGLLLEIRVLGFEIGDRVGIVLVGQPGVFVDHGVAVMSALGGDLLRRWRRVAAHGGSLCSAVIVLWPALCQNPSRAVLAAANLLKPTGCGATNLFTSVTLACVVLASDGNPL